MFQRNKMPCMSEESVFTVNSPFFPPPSAFLLWCLLSQFTCFPFEMWKICDWKQPVSKNSMHVLSRDFCCIVTTLLPYCFHTQCKNSNHHQSLLFLVCWCRPPAKKVQGSSAQASLTWFNCNMFWCQLHTNATDWIHPPCRLQHQPVFCILMLWGRTSVTYSHALHWEAVKPEVWSDQHWEEQGKTIALCCTDTSGKPKSMTDWNHRIWEDPDLRFWIFEFIWHLGHCRSETAKKAAIFTVQVISASNFLNFEE